MGRLQGFVQKTLYMRPEIENTLKATAAARRVSEYELVERAMRAFFKSEGVRVKGSSK